MKINVYAVKDLKLGFMSPFIRQNNDIALRDLMCTYCDPSPNYLNLTPADYELWLLGEFDNMSGQFTSAPVYVANGLEIKAQAEAIVFKQRSVIHGVQDNVQPSDVES